MHRIRIKPLSVNESYRGRKFKTPALAKYKKDLQFLLPKIEIPCGMLHVHYVFGVSSRRSDGDNLIKSFQDTLSEVYGFNDNIIYSWFIEKKIVNKGEEYIEFS